MKERKHEKIFMKERKKISVNERDNERKKIYVKERKKERKKENISK